MNRTINNDSIARIVKQELIKLQEEDDIEVSHTGADNIICDFIIALGYKDIVDEYDKIHKYYS